MVMDADQAKREKNLADFKLATDALIARLTLVENTAALPLAFRELATEFKTWYAAYKLTWGS